MRFFIGVESLNSATTRYRALVPARCIAANGHSVKIGAEIAKESIGEFDRIVLHRGSTRGVLELIEAAAERGVGVVYDIDDDIFNIDPSNPAFGIYMANPAIPWHQLIAMRFSDALVVSTPRLREVYGILHSQISVVRNYVDLDEIREPCARVSFGEDRVVLVWAGSNTHADSLELLKEPLSELFKKHKNILLVILGLMENPFRSSISSSQVVLLGWSSYPTYHAILRSAQIGLAPLADTRFNWAKSDLRIKELAAARLPVVGSPTGEYARSIAECGGFLCKNAAEWFLALDALILDPELRQAAAKRAWEWVQQWDIRAGWQYFLDAWSGKCASGTNL